MSTSTARWPLVTLVVMLLTVNLIGAPYYLLPMEERVRSPLHAWLRPSGYIGQTAGLLALAIFIFLWMYPLRKRYRWLAFTGAIGRWLDVHITVALALPLLLAIHAAWRFGGLIGLGFDAMMIVVASGVVGRYLYVRIPRSRSGVELTLEEVQRERESLVGELAARTSMTPAEVHGMLALPDRASNAGIGGAFIDLLRGDVTRWRAGRALRRRLRARARDAPALDPASIEAAVRLARREIALDQQVRFLDATHRVFRFWHVAHRPIALTALIAVLVHIAVVVVLGATWFW